AVRGTAHPAGLGTRGTIFGMEILEPASRRARYAGRDWHCNPRSARTQVTYDTQQFACLREASVRSCGSVKRDRATLTSRDTKPLNRLGFMPRISTVPD